MSFCSSPDLIFSPTLETFMQLGMIFMQLGMTNACKRSRGSPELPRDH